MRLESVHALGPLIAAAAAANFFLAAWAFIAGLAGRRTLGTGFWALLLLSIALILINAGAGVLLAAGGARPRTPLHFLYGILVTLAAVAQYGLRPGGFLRTTVQRTLSVFNEPRTLALICLTQAALLLRAYMTGAIGK